VKRRLFLFFVLFTVAIGNVVPAWADDDETSTTAPATKDPFDVTVGFDPDSNNFGATMKGSRMYFDEKRIYDSSNPNFNPWRAAYAEVSTDAYWGASPDALNNASVSFRPGLMRWFSRTVTANGVAINQDTLNHLEIYADARVKYGQFKGESADAAVLNVNQTLVGAGVDWAFAGALVRWIASQEPDDGTGDDPFAAGTESNLDATPVLSLRYYHVIDTSDSPQDVPAGIDADKLVMQFKGDLSVPRISFGETRLRFLFDAKATYPTRGSERDVETFVDIAIAAKMPNVDVQPVVRYVSGENEGFTFDKQILAGFLWNFARR
jgi:hypothetical protein